MKKYLLFLGAQYYPCGGWKDFHGEFDSIKEAVQFVTDNPRYNEEGCMVLIDWAHITDTNLKQVVWRFYERFNETTRRNETVWGI